MRIAMLAVDLRDAEKDWSRTEIRLGPAVQSLLAGFRQFPEHEVHVLMGMRGNPQPVRRQDNLHFHDVPMGRWAMMKSGYVGAVRAFRRHLRGLRPDIVHGQGTERDCALGAVGSGFPSVVTVHGNVRLIAKLLKARPFSHLWITARLESLALPRAGGVLCITRYTQEAVKGLARRTWVIPNAVSPGFFEVAPAPASPPVVLFIGNPDARKAQNRFIRWMDPLAREVPFRLVFLGRYRPGDPYAEEFLRLVAERPWCRYDGYLDEAGVRERLRAATLLVLPTREDNCPMVVLEAMAAGVPVAASRVGGVPELIEDGVTGLLCDPDDAEGFRGAVAAAVRNPARAQELAARARAEAERRFHPREIAREHLRLYGEILAAR